MLGPLRYCPQASTQTFCLLINTLCLGDSDLSQVCFSSQCFHISRLESDCLSVSETRCCSVAKSRVTLCEPMDCSTPGRQASLSFSVSRSLLRRLSIESVVPPTISSSVAPFSCPRSFPASAEPPSGHLVEYIWPPLPHTFFFLAELCLLGRRTWQAATRCCDPSRT